MPLNQLKEYNNLLDLESLTDEARKKSLQIIFNRDFISSTNYFNSKIVTPTHEDGQVTMGRLFNHLTRTIDKCGNTNQRVFDIHRSRRIHWIKYHLDNSKRVDVFSVREKKGIRTYLFDKKEAYVIILEPIERGSKKYYFLITAYYLSGGNIRKIKNKERRKLNQIY